VPDQNVSISRRWIIGSLPGPSRTITVEPVRVPVPPRVTPAAPPDRVPRPERAPRPQRAPAQTASPSQLSECTISGGRQRARPH